MQLCSLGVPWVSGKNEHLRTFQTPCHQGQTKCDMKGRDCIEENFSRKFYCNSTCEGVYADVQKVDSEAKEMMKAE